MEVTAVFDIGKTNKKFILFDATYNEVDQKFAHFKEKLDEDGFPVDDLQGIMGWMNDVLHEVLADRRWKIRKLNFSTYGASFVHIDAGGNPITPLYNYLKPFPTTLEQQFFKAYGPEYQWSTNTASPFLGMLNSGLQLYWLKHEKKHLFDKIRWSLHFPQYCSYFFTKFPVSEYTSLGCHTGMWDFAQNRYHKWIVEENILGLLPPVQPATKTFVSRINGQIMEVGSGIHDSSAALLPYLYQSKDLFLLLSTGTWNITLNPFNRDPITPEELNLDCLNYLRPDGLPVKAARLFLGHEHELWTQQLANHFSRPANTYTDLTPETIQMIPKKTYPSNLFKWKSIRKYPPLDPVPETDLSCFGSYEEAYLRLIEELIEMQAKDILLAKGNTNTKKVYIDGGFAGNALFIHTLRKKLPDFEFINTQHTQGSALGAALAVTPENASTFFETML